MMEVSQKAQHMKHMVSFTFLLIANQSNDHISWICVLCDCIIFIAQSTPRLSLDRLSETSERELGIERDIIRPHGSPCYSSMARFETNRI